MRTDSKNLFYPLFAEPESGKIVTIGDSIPLGVPKESVTVPDGLIAIWPMTSDGREARWRTGTDVAKRRLSKGLLRLGKTTKKENGWSVLTVNEGTEEREVKIWGIVIFRGYERRMVQQFWKNKPDSQLSKFQKLCGTEFHTTQDGMVQNY